MTLLNSTTDENMVLNFTSNPSGHGHRNIVLHVDYLDERKTFESSTNDMDFFDNVIGTLVENNASSDEFNQAYYDKFYVENFEYKVNDWIELLNENNELKNKEIHAEQLNEYDEFKNEEIRGVLFDNHIDELIKDNTSKKKEIIPQKEDNHKNQFINPLNQEKMENSQKNAKNGQNSQTENLKENFLKTHPEKRDAITKIMNEINHDNVSGIANDLISFSKDNFKALPVLASKFMDNTKNYLERLKTMSKLQGQDGVNFNFISELLKNNQAAAIIVNKGLQSPYNDVRYYTSTLIESRMKYLQDSIDDPKKAEYKEKNKATLDSFEKFVFNDYHNKENAILFKAVRPELSIIDKYLTENQILRLEKLDNGKSLELPEKTYLNNYEIENLKAIANGKMSELINDTMKFKFSMNEQKELEVVKFSKLENLNIPSKLGNIEISEDNKVKLLAGETVSVPGTNYNTLLAVDAELNRVIALNSNYAERIIPSKLLEVEITKSMIEDLKNGKTLDLQGFKNNDKTFDASIKFDVIKEKVVFLNQKDNVPTLAQEKKNKVTPKL